MLTCVAASSKDAKRVRAVRQLCGADMVRKYGLGHWGHTPTLHAISKSAKDGALFYLETDDGEIVATFTLREQAQRFYDLSMFRHPDAKAAYLTGLAVRPSQQGKGVGRQTMATAEKIAKANGCTAIRLDVYDKPAGAIGFYQKCGYKSRGKNVFKDMPLVYLEKEI